MATIGAKFRDWPTYVKGRLGEKIGNHLPDVVVYSTYATSDIFLFPQGVKTAFEYIEKTLDSQPYFDFSTAGNSIISVGKIALTGISIGIFTDTVRRLLGKGPKEIKAEPLSRPPPPATPSQSQ